MTTVLSLSLFIAKIDAATSNWVGYNEIVLLTISSFSTSTFTAPHRHMLG